MTKALQHKITRKKLKNMAKEENLHHKVNKEMAKFEKTMEELHLLESVSKHLKNYRKMIKLKKYD